jgi:hypothetical protein
VTRLIIDADPIVYRSGFASEEHHYHVVVENPDETVEEAYFRPMPDPKDATKTLTAGDQMKAWIGDRTIILKDMEVKPEPKDHALHLVSQEMRSIVKAVARKFDTAPSEMQITTVLSGPDNFREKIATLKPYKGNRKADYKPYHYQAIRDYLTGRWDAKVVQGREADDEVSILAWESRTDKRPYVVATIDKDLDQVPGWHYDYRQKVFYKQSREEARLTFWRQVLSGDATDNIGGVYRIGPEKAEGIVRDWTVQYGDDEKLYWVATLAAYEDSKGKKGCPYADKDTHAVALENARLVYMQTIPQELWTPPGVPREWLEPGTAD